MIAGAFAAHQRYGMFDERCETKVHLADKYCVGAVISGFHALDGAS
jgi:hypothetical protein